MKLSRLLSPFRKIDQESPAGRTAIRSCARTHMGRVRAVNEDRLLDMPERGLWAVADGMGGHSAGDVAAALVVAELEGRMAASDGDVLAALDSANRRIRDRGGAGGMVSGSTVAALRIDGDRFSLFWAGDSRVYRFRDGALERLSHDHSLVQALVDAGTISAESARRHPQANVITRALGTAEHIEIETAAGRLMPGDVFLLCSDGLSGSIDDADIATQLALPIEIAADLLLSLALAAGGPDNISLVLVAAPDAV